MEKTLSSWAVRYLEDLKQARQCSPHTLGVLGFFFVRVLRPLNAHWTTWYNGVFWGHFVICNALLFYTPFSRFAHIIMSPLIVTLNGMRLLVARFNLTSSKNSTLVEPHQQSGYSCNSARQ